MTREPVQITPDAMAYEALKLMEDRPSQIAVLPVVEDGRCLGPRPPPRPRADRSLNVRLPALRRFRRAAMRPRYEDGHTEALFVDRLADDDLERLNDLLPWRCFTVDSEGRPFGGAGLERQARRAADHPRSAHRCASTSASTSPTSTCSRSAASRACTRLRSAGWRSA